MIIAVLVLALGYFAIDKFVLAPRRVFSPNDSSAAINAQSIAVLPFENLSEDKANAYFAEGMQDEILTRLAKITDLKVMVVGKPLTVNEGPTGALILYTKAVPLGLTPPPVT